MAKILTNTKISLMKLQEVIAYKHYKFNLTPLKILIKIHRGLSKSLKLKIVDDYLVSYNKK